MKRKLKQISITGEPGAGKSTTRTLLEQRLGYPVHNNGEYGRELCEKMGYEFKNYEVFMKDFPQLDEVIDASCVKASEDNETLIIDARLGWHFVPNSYKVYLTCKLDEAVKRIYRADRKNERYPSMEVCKVATKKRFDDENARFQEKYGVSNVDLSQYDLVVDTTCLSEDAVVDKILEGYEAWLKET